MKHIDVFPAKVTIERDDGVTHELDRVRVRTDGPNIEVWAETQAYPHQPELVYTATIENEVDNTIDPHLPVNRQHATLVTDTAVMSVKRSGGCGCGSRLYNLPQTRYQQQAQESQLMAALRGHFPDAQF